MTNALLIKTETLTGIADAIREKTGSTETIAVTDLAEKVEEVYDAGAKSEYDRFWDTVQNYNQPSECYTGAFGAWMTPETFKPKYKTFMVDKQASMMFVRTAFYTDAIDMSGITFQFTNCSSISRMFNNAHLKNMTVDFSGVKTLTLPFDCSFNGGDKLENITVKITEETTSISMLLNYGSDVVGFYCTPDSVIACNGVDFTTDKSLSRESLLSFLNALKDYSSYTGSTTWKITLGSTNLAKLSAADQAIATQKGWVLA